MGFLREDLCFPRVSPFPLPSMQQALSTGSEPGKARHPLASDGEGDSYGVLDLEGCKMGRFSFIGGLALGEKGMLFTSPSSLFLLWTL